MNDRWRRLLAGAVDDAANVVVVIAAAQHNLLVRVAREVRPRQPRRTPGSAAEHREDEWYVRSGLVDRKPPG